MTNDTISTIEATWSEIDNAPLLMKYIENYSSIELAKRFQAGKIKSLSQVAQIISDDVCNPTFEEFCENG